MANVYITRYNTCDGMIEGPRIHANSMEDAERIADLITENVNLSSGPFKLEVVGKLIMELESYELN